MEIKIDKNTYWAKDDNHHKAKSIKKQIVIGSSLRKNGNHIIRLQHKEFGKSKRWNTFTITREGKIYQHFDDELHSNFLDIKNGDKQSISIILENMGSLFKTTTDDYINWIGEKCDKELVIEKNWMGYRFWEKYTENQINSLIFLTKMMCNKHNIPKELIDFNHYHENIVKFRGIVYRSNYIENSSDVNPSFDSIKFNEKIKE